MESQTTYTDKFVGVFEWFRTKQMHGANGDHRYIPQMGNVTRETEKAVLIDGKWWVPKKCVSIIVA